jgi:hypothetical protein
MTRCPSETRLNMAAVTTSRVASTGVGKADGISDRKKNYRQNQCGLGVDLEMSALNSGRSRKEVNSGSVATS